MAKPRKKIYLINRDFQLRYSFAATFVGLASTLVTAIVVLYPLYTFEILRIPRFLPLPILIAMCAAAFLNILIVGLFGVFITHRIAGPMYAIVKCFRRIEMGRWAGHLKIRESDDLKYLVRNFNQMVDGLVDTGRTDLKALDQLKAKFESLGLGSNDIVSDLDSLKTKMSIRLKEAHLEGLSVEKP